MLVQFAQQIFNSKMRFITIALFVIIAVSQAIGDKESQLDKAGQEVNKVYDEYNREINDLKQKVNSLKDKAEDLYNEQNRNMADQLGKMMSSLRERRSPQTFPDSQKNPTDEALDKLSDSFSEFKDNVGKIAQNVSNSDFISGLGNQFNKFKSSVSEVGEKIKSSIHNFTAPDKKDSSEENH